MDNYKTYSEIKRLLNEYWEIKNGARYDEFIMKLTEVLKI